MPRHTTRHAAHPQRPTPRGGRLTAPGVLATVGLLAEIVVVGIPMGSAQAGERGHGSPQFGHVHVHVHVADAVGHGGAHRGRTPARPPQNTPVPTPPVPTPPVPTPPAPEPVSPDPVSPEPVTPDLVEPVTDVVTDPAPEPGVAAPATTVNSEVMGAEVVSLVLPPSGPLGEVLDAVVPTPGTASAELVAGFPTAITIAPESEIRNSELSVLDSVVIARMSAATPLGSVAVLEHYAESLSALGLSGTPAVTTGENTVQTFYRGNDSVVVTVDSAVQGSQYSLVGTFSLPG